MVFNDVCRCYVMMYVDGMNDVCRCYVMMYVDGMSW
jgi:hypothetical protein